ncbi:SDR family NAD(P)-dependent oxidoreductase [Alphaproteobacteria bacterium GH1-50]|uniref:SDR family NAD(P)-dependent oxidoreductase n=1 Tax=Kangsaoukella pontilimi TaxID=2691042 RepID=A0A7C9MWL9_9RHOB|nr:oxidoreductase [Kangsaoukella pontilimi]MXQ08460.1 SDR family NAD(P)-dependent oxidoreductase [Kangsaoukella pontilimi]
MARKYDTVLVTGASSGMGKDFAHRLLKSGYTVFAAARSVDKMQDLKDAGAIVIGMDIARDEDITAAVEIIRERTGGVDILINNAGFAQYGPVEETPVEKARYQFEVNLFGLARLTQLLIPDMREKGKGLIVNLSSMGGVIYTPMGAWYHATKHAVEGWSDALRFELEPFGIDVVILQPGIIRTGFGEALESNYQGDETGPYGNTIRAMKEGTQAMYDAGKGSDPREITDLLMQAVRAERPKPRYSAGYMARPSMMMRRLLPDRWFDRLLRSQIG